MHAWRCRVTTSNRWPFDGTAYRSSPRFSSTMKTQNTKLTLGALGFALLLNPASAAVASLPLAQIPTELKTGFQYGLGILFMVGFIWGVINIWGGAEKMKRGDAEGKMGIVSGIIIAGAAAIMSALFYIFGLSDGALAPQF